MKSLPYLKRKLTPVERYYVCFDSFDKPRHSPCVNQMTIEGEGEFCEQAWRDAVAIASRANSSSRLRMVGKLGMARWVVQDETAPVRVIDDPQWNGLGSDGCPYDRNPLFSDAGPTCEVVLVKGKKLYVVFRTHHGVMDGRGTLLFAEDVFRVINGEKPLGENTKITDYELLKQIDAGISKEYDCSRSPPTGAVDKTVSGNLWIRRFLPGRHRKVLAKVALAIRALVLTDETVRIQIPVDMRRHIDPDIRFMGNLTGSLVQEVSRETTVDDWNRSIRQQLSENRDAQIPAAAAKVSPALLLWLPLRTMRKINNKADSKRLNAGRFRFNGLISNLGVLPLDSYAGGGFKGKTCFFVPPEADAIPMFLTLAGSAGGVDIALRIPASLATENRAAQALDFVVDFVNGFKEHCAPGKASSGHRGR